VDPEWNFDLGVTFTVHDPCQLVRKSLGDEVADDLRYVVCAVVGEENFVDLRPAKSDNYCCGGGGGALQAGNANARRAFGRRKHEQIAATGASYCITPCHNCHTQIQDLAKAHGGRYRAVHLWTLICLSLGVLGPEERQYLGADLQAVGV